MWKRLKGWRTVIFNGSAIVLLSLSPFVSYLVSADWSSIIHNPKTLFAVTVGLNLCNILLRVITTTPLGVKEPTE